MAAESPKNSILPAVSVVIVNYNGRAFLPALFDSLGRLDYPAENVEIVFVDNGSSDRSVEDVKADWPHVRVVKSERNLGFAGGCNLGIRAASADYIALLNNDTEVDPGWLRALVNAIESDPELGAAASKILFMTDRARINNAGLNLYSNATGGDRGMNEPDDGRFDEEVDVFGGCGASVLLRREMIEDVGVLDASFFMYYEDLDLAWRSQLRGWRCRYVPTSVVYHVHCGSSKIGSPFFCYHVERNRVFVNLKNGRWPWVFRALAGLARRSVLSWTKLLTAQRSWAMTWAYTRAWFSIGWHLPALLGKRLRIRVLRRRVPEKQIEAWVTDPPGAKAGYAVSLSETIDDFFGVLWHVFVRPVGKFVRRPGVTLALLWDTLRDRRNGLRVRIRYGTYLRVRRRVGARRKAARLHRAKAVFATSSRASKVRAFVKPQVVDVVVCVHNAYEHVKNCLEALSRHAADTGVIIVDDGSDRPTQELAAEFAGEHGWKLIRHSEAWGYTRSANHGLRESSADLVILLNSDTIVTANWISGLVDCLESDPAIGIVGPLSNAGGYQSVPELSDLTGGWSLNPLPKGMEVDEMARIVRAARPEPTFPKVPMVNGFCFGVARDVLEKVGLLDEEAFPRGYGEETDLCVRATNAGFSLAVADHTYVFHAKTQSFTAAHRVELGRAGQSALKQRHGELRMLWVDHALKTNEGLKVVRATIKKELSKHTPDVLSNLPQDVGRVLFLLPVPGGAGGAHSVVQEARGMRSLGVNAQVAIRRQHEPHYRRTYQHMSGSEKLFFAYDDDRSLVAEGRKVDVAIATLYSSVWLLQQIVTAHPTVLPAYYIQDYEPWFFDEGDPERQRALQSYELIDDMLLYAKTDWLRETVEERHGRSVEKVQPSLDRSVYFPENRRSRNPVRVAAMIRPRTPRRSAHLTMRVLKRAREEYGAQLELLTFGCSFRDLRLYDVPRDFKFRHLGHVPRETVADVLRSSDVFVDFSTYQAFGRTGLEAMACGCAVILPTRGGVGEYALDGTNALLVDTSDENACLAQLLRLVEDAKLRQGIQLHAEVTSKRYSIRAAAFSELMVLRRRLASRTRNDVGPGARVAAAANET